MGDSLFVTVNLWLQGSVQAALAGSFLWGMISVTISPCHMASIPLMIAYVGGQNNILPPRQATWYAVNFTFGLFLTIILVGVACLALGRLLGDVGPYWSIGIGVLLIWVAVGMFRTQKCTSTGPLLNKFQVKGKTGAFLLGLAYGVVSGVCTFGFLAPILGVITTHGKTTTGLFMVLLFGAGHCLPLIAAGTFSATVGNFLQNLAWQNAAHRFRQGSALLIFILGIYLGLGPFI